MKKINRIIPAVIAGFLGVLAFPAFAGAETTNTEVITESDVVRQAHNTPPTPGAKWVLYSRDTGTGTFRNGPGTPPAGTGSLEFKTTTDNDKAYLFNYEHVGTTLSDINSLSYSTYRTAGSAQQDTALNLEVDFNGPNVEGGFTTLVFEPVYNTAQGSVVNDQWQSWNAYGNEAKWWSTKAINDQVAFTQYRTWSEIVASNPDATILGGIGVNQGGGNPGLTAAVDKFTFGTTANTVTYNFELTKPESKPVKATNKDQCKDGGYKNFQTDYKNQGDCVSSVTSNSKSKESKNDTPFTSLTKLFGL